jgi:hypothetical protein
MKIQLVDGLPYTTVTLFHHNRQITLDNVLVDTGSAGTIFPTDQVLTIGLRLERDDIVHRIRGVGGAEFVFTKPVDVMALGGLRVNNFGIEIGAMDYGFQINGIIGMDFLLQIEAIVDLDALEIYGSAGKG